MNQNFKTIINFLDKHQSKIAKFAYSPRRNKCKLESYQKCSSLSSSV